MRNDGEEITRVIRQEIARHGLDSQIHTTRTRCNGRCDDACVVIVYPEGTWYLTVTPEVAEEIVNLHLLRGEVVNSSASYRYTQDGLIPSSQSPIGISKPSGNG